MKFPCTHSRTRPCVRCAEFFKAKCPGCGMEFNRLHGLAKFCSVKCGNEMRQRLRRLRLELDREVPG